MGKVYGSVDELIGRTPLLELANIERTEGLRARVLAKLEYFNPAGSVKDRVAKSMLDAAEAAGEIRPTTDTPSSSPRAATPASAFPRSPPRAGTAPSS